ncbi:hypothetical protein [Euzebya tangerina]|uniref:hypothetical protein n=1 Tax=Euzebya tangerina TaxID=591198 RepID=UPI000E31EC0F|nr:hypothetical protein [Euzebya tangerina]
MTRADVHYALAIDREIWEASRVDPDLLDPVVRVDAIPGTTHPFVVLRDYQGPQGTYLEYFTLADATGSEIFRSSERKVDLRGEMFQDRVITTIPRLQLDRGDEHEMSFFVDGDLVNSIPMFLEVGEGGDPSVMAEETLSKALGKGAVMWIQIPKKEKVSRLKKIRNRPRGLVYDNHQQPVWFIFDSGVIYVFSGPTEQEVDGLTPETEEVRIVARSKDLRSAVVRTTAKVEVVPTDDPRWTKAAESGIGKRLNLPDGEGAIDRWRENCTLYALTPEFAGAPRVAATDGAAAAAADAEAEAEDKPEVTKRPEDDIHVEAQIDQEVFDELIAEGKSERVARAKAKAAYVRAEKKRILAEQQSG